MRGGRKIRENPSASFGTFQMARYAPQESEPIRHPCDCMGGNFGESFRIVPLCDRHLGELTHVQVVTCVFLHLALKAPQKSFR
jgi:hypothetical protein